MKVDLLRDATAVILCGGKSSRMGFDKAFLKIENEFLLENLVNRLGKLFRDVAIVTNRKNKFGNEPFLASSIVWEDHYLEKGPVGGICTALEQCTTAYIFVMACDMPEVDLSLIEKMAECGEEDTQVVICESAGKQQPLFAFYHVSCVELFQQQLAMGKLRLRENYSHWRVKVLSSDSISNMCFFNLNTQEDVIKWKTGQ